MLGLTVAFLPITENLDRQIVDLSVAQRDASFGAQIEVVAKELPSMAEARKLERSLKRKKNPLLAISDVASTSHGAARDSGWFRVRTGRPRTFAGQIAALGGHLHQPWMPESLEPSLAFSRLPADGVLFEVGVHSAAYGRIEVCGAEAFK